MMSILVYWHDGDAFDDGGDGIVQTSNLSLEHSCSVVDPFRFIPENRGISDISSMSCLSINHYYLDQKKLLPAEVENHVKHIR